MGYQTGPDGFSIKYTGQYRDTETRLDYFNARYYSAEQGRFVSPDPGNAGADQGNPLTWNGYAYVGNNPMNVTDPAGLGFGDLLGGVMFGYENANYDSSLSSATLKNNGVVVGPYLGWRFAGNLLLDGAVTLSKLKYDSTTAGVKGSFDSDRIISAIGLSGTSPVGALVFNPSLRATYLTETQDAWTDSASVAHADQTTTGAEGSFGTKILYPIDTDSKAKVSPYIGLYGDAFEGSDVDRRTSGRAGIGADATLNNGWVFHLGYENSGIGVDLKQWSVDGLVSMPF